MEIQINWHNLDPSPSVNAEIAERFEKLQTFCSQITSAHITIDRPNPTHHAKSSYRVVLEVHVPGTEVVVSHHPTGEDFSLRPVIHHAFAAARRQVQDYVRIRRGQVKQHAPRKAAEPPTEPTTS